VDLFNLPGVMAGCSCQMQTRGYERGLLLTNLPRFLAPGKYFWLNA